MKKFSHIPGAFVLFAAAQLLFSCEETGPAIDLTGNTAADTTYVAAQVETPQARSILLEEFTGVRCVNCPTGHELLENLEAQHGEKFIAFSAHSPFLAEPYAGDQDLRVPEAQALENLLGPALSKPSASIDRILFSGESSLLVFSQKWAAYVNQRLSATTPVNVHIAASFNNAARSMDVVITLHYTAEETAENKLMVLLTEDNIITAQLDHGGVDSNYTQHRVLRKTLTSTNGLSLASPMEAGRVIVKSFRLENIPALWKADDLHVIAYVHRSGATMEVLQAVRKKVK